MAIQNLESAAKQHARGKSCSGKAGALLHGESLRVLAFLFQEGKCVSALPTYDYFPFKGRGYWNGCIPKNIYIRNIKI